MRDNTHVQKLREPYKKKEKLLLYCTKSKPYITYDSVDKDFWLTTIPELMLNGKIAVECECDLVEEITSYDGYKTKTLSTEELYKKSCLDAANMNRYLKCEEGYGLHLKNVKIFDKPLSFKTDYIYKKSYRYETVQKAPQSMMIVYDRHGNRYILLPIKPQYLVKIMNGEKTIEVRRKILKELKELIK